MARVRSVLRTVFAGFMVWAVFLASPSAFGQESGPAGKEEYNNRLVAMLEAYQGLLAEKLDEDVPDMAGNAWYVVSHALADGRLRFTVNPANGNLLEGARFHPATSDDEPGYIVVSRLLLDTWETHPSIAYSLITRAFSDGASFFLNPEGWLKVHKSLLDSIYMNTGLYTTMAGLIRDRLMPSGLVITPYEAFLLDSFEKDRLASALVFLEGVSLPVAQSVLEAGSAFEESGDAAALRAQLLELGRSLLDAREKLPADVADEEMFPLAAAVHTWLETTPEILSRVYNKDRPEKPLMFGQVLEKEPEYRELRRLMEASRIRDMPKLKHVVNSTNKSFASL